MAGRGRRCSAAIPLSPRKAAHPRVQGAGWPLLELGVRIGLLANPVTISARELSPHLLTLLHSPNGPQPPPFQHHPSNADAPHPARLAGRGRCAAGGRLLGQAPHAARNVRGARCAVLPCAGTAQVACRPRRFSEPGLPSSTACHSLPGPTTHCRQCWLQLFSSCMADAGSCWPPNIAFLSGRAHAQFSLPVACPAYVPAALALLPVADRPD